MWGENSIPPLYVQHGAEMKAFDWVDLVDFESAQGLFIGWKTQLKPNVCPFNGPRMHNRG